MHCMSEYHWSCGGLNGSLRRNVGCNVKRLAQYLGFA